jgi:hypothetical protein
MSQKRVIYYIAETLYLFLILFLCYTAANKFVNIDSFRTNLIKTTIFTKEVAHYFSYIVITLEIIVILLLIFYKKIGLVVFSITMLIFTAYISYLRFNELYEVCGCGGVLNGLEYKYHFVINLFLLFGSVFSLYFINKYEK